MTHPNKREVHAKAMELNQKRKECNAIILKKLTEYLRDNPSMRFNQALINLDIVVNARDLQGIYSTFCQDDYYTEPSEVLKRMK